MITKMTLAICGLCLLPLELLGWTSGQLLIWMDNDRAQAVRQIAKGFEEKWGIKVTIEAPPNLTDNFLIAAQVLKGPDIVIWAHDKVGEWARAGLISPINLTPGFMGKFDPKVWEAVQNRNSIWGYPISLETVTLIYNKRLLPGPPPADLAGLAPLNRLIHQKKPGIRTILWDSRSAYYSWGILASAGAYVFKRQGTDYDLNDIGVDTPGAVAALSQIISLVDDGILPTGPVDGQGERLIAEGQLAMTISGPWTWPNLTRAGIDFGIAPVPGINGKRGRPFVGVSVAYINRFSPNRDLSRQFLEQNLLTDEGLLAMNRAKPIGVPALTSLYLKLIESDTRLRDLKTVIDHGEIMPNIPEMGRFFTAVGAALETAINGQTSAQEALQTAAETMRAR